MTDQKNRKTTKSFYTLMVLLLALLAGGAYLAVQNPAIFKVEKHDVAEDIATLKLQVQNLEQKLETYHKQLPAISQEDIVKFSQKVDGMHKINLEILNTKASMASVMGLTERVDTIESNVKKLGAVSSQAALILTATTLVEEAAKKGQPFTYEATVLQNLSQGTIMENEATRIASFSDSQLLSKKALIKKFEFLYDSQEQVEEPQSPSDEKQENKQDWKEKILTKLKSLIIVRKIETHNNKQITPEERVLELVQKGEFNVAMLKMEVEPKFQTEEFEIWKENVRSYNVFCQELSKIKAQTLGLMKAEGIKKANQ